MPTSSYFWHVENIIIKKDASCLISLGGKKNIYIIKSLPSISEKRMTQIFLFKIPAASKISHKNPKTINLLYTHFFYTKHAKDQLINLILPKHNQYLWQHPVTPSRMRVLSIKWVHCVQILILFTLYFDVISFQDW